MVEIILGLVAIVVGLLFCFGGAPLMRIVITIWGALAGFGLGSGLITHFTGDHFLGTALGWIVGLGLALIFAVLAYLYYFVAVTIAMAGVGFALGGAIMAAIGVTWNWVVILIAVAFGLVFAVVAIVADLPLVFLQVFSAMGGAAVAVAGLMLLFGSIDIETFTGGGYLAIVREHWWWWIVYAIAAVLGILAQGRAAHEQRESIRRNWATTS
ncbi:MAG TPA: DUF4203 domain-containing protein [Marmoricola sp.]|jgi:hypothetical protein|nr:DUF4203 domain-containing protein [Nocardioidaceae bacterium]MCO5323917.1 DUF4203 domain-containing protein [Nocardioidaceae bacterium]HRV68632.1 DUF4203 domain-containing protein [Marmoricola sp.]